MCAKRKGSLLLDALLGMMILLFAIIPLISSITFAYGALTSSVEKRARLDEIYSQTAMDIVDFSMGNKLGFFGDFGHPTNITLNGGHSNPATVIVPTLCYKEEPFGVGWRDRNSILRVHIVK